MAAGERKVALVPKMVASKGWVDGEYALVLTDIRALFVLERRINRALIQVVFLSVLLVGFVLAILWGPSNGTGLFLAIGAAGLATAAVRASMRQTYVDYDAATPVELAAREGTLSVAYASMDRLEILRPNRRIVHLFRLAYTDGAGAPQTLPARLVPKTGWIRDRRAERMPPREIYATYAQAVRDALQVALPSDDLSRLARSS